MEKFKRQRKWIKETLPTACGYNGKVMTAVSLRMLNK